MVFAHVRPTATERTPLPPALHSRALADLQFIRNTMASATSYTAFSGWGLVLVGIGALLCGLIALQRPRLVDQLNLWIVDAGLSLAVGALSSVLKARSAGQSLTVGPIRKFSLSFAPAILAGGVLTATLIRTASAGLLPGVWILLYGTGLASAGALSVRIIPIIGGCFFALGAVALISDPWWANALLMIGFGGLHVVLGLVIARRFGG